jgi:hypothetical protein
MLLGILITVIITAALGYSLASERRGGMIDHHGYNNRHNDATGARRDHLG